MTVTSESERNTFRPNETPPGEEAGELLTFRLLDYIVPRCVEHVMQGFGIRYHESVILSINAW